LKESEEVEKWSRWNGFGRKRVHSGIYFFEGRIRLCIKFE